MSKTKISTKGQTVIPRYIREKYGLSQGMQIEWLPWTSNAFLVRKAIAQKKISWSKWLEKIKHLDKTIWNSADPIKYTHEIWDKRD